MKKVSLALILALITTTAFAGGPIRRAFDGRPGVHPTDQPLIYNLDPGRLTLGFDFTTLQNMATTNFNTWNSVEGSRLVIQAGPNLGTDVTTLDQLNDLINIGMNPVIWDETGAIFTELGLGSLTLAIAGPYGPSTALEHNGFFAVFGGPPFDGAAPSSLQSTMLHEFGHAIGLGHSNLNGHDFATSSSYLGFGRPPQSSVEIMYWQAVHANTTLHQDEISGLLALYGTGDQGRDGGVAISGRVLFPDGSGADGINVVVREQSEGASSVFNIAASTITCCGNSGAYRITGLPPGTYTVEITDIGDDADRFGNSGAYSDPIRTNNVRSQATTIIGPFPGEEEFFNGASESSDPAVDNAGSFSLLTLNAGDEAENINIILNREDGILGTSLANVYTIPEVRSFGEEETYIGIVNPNDSSVNLEIFGFNAGGTNAIRVEFVSSLAAKGAMWMSASELFGENADQVSWIQVGAGGSLHVIGELHTPTTRSAFWANRGLTDQAFMPHVARDTASFETVIASVNGTRNALTTTLTTQPDLAVAGLNEHELSYAKASNVLSELFDAEDFAATEWVDLTSSAPGTASMEYFTTLPNRGQQAALSLDSKSGTTLRFLHIAADINLFWTGMVYINTGDDDVQVTETYYNDQSLPFRVVNRTLSAGEKITLLAHRDVESDVPEGAVWLEVSVPEDSGNNLIGYELFGSPDLNAQDVFAGLQGSFSSGTTLAYPHFTFGENAFTALVAINLGDVTTDLAFTAYDAQGNPLETAVVEGIPANTKVTRLVGNGANPLFTNPNTLANAAWVEASGPESLWSGFMLWGDQQGTRQYLSGIVAAESGELAGSERLVIQEEGPNNSYANAMVIPSTEGSFNVNVIASTDRGETGSVVNTCSTCGPNGDDYEDVFMFTVEETTELLIAITPDDVFKDLDLMVVSAQQASQDFTVFNYGLNGDVFASAGFFGTEGMLHRFEPGTYYILVSHWDAGNDQSFSDEYGLLVTSQPMYKNTFSTQADVDEVTFALIPNDSDGVASWDYATNIPESEFGGALSQTTPSTGIEASGFITPSVVFPITGTTVVDFDMMVLTYQPAVNSSFFLSFINPGLDNQVNLGGFNVNSGFQGNIPVTFGGGSVQSSGWLRWGGIITDPGLQVPSASFAGATWSILPTFRATSSVGFLVDNVRLYNMQTSQNPTKGGGQVIAAPLNREKPKDLSVIINRDKIIQAMPINQ